MNQSQALLIMYQALDKIRDPRKRHKEPDKYTELACVMNIADEAIQTLISLGIDEEAIRNQNQSQDQSVC